jgi:hypothetical protein
VLTLEPLLLKMISLSNFSIILLGLFVADAVKSFSLVVVFGFKVGFCFR